MIPFVMNIKLKKSDSGCSGIAKRENKVLRFQPILIELETL